MKEHQKREELTEDETKAVNGGPKKLFVGSLSWDTTDDGPASRSGDGGNSVIVSDPGFGIVQSG